MPKKPASPKPDAGQSAGSLEQIAKAYDRAIAPAAFKDPAPGIEDRGEPEDQGPPVGATSVSIPGVDESSESLIAVVARQHARIVSLESRVDALAEVHRQNTGKVI